MRFYTQTKEFVFEDPSQYPASRPVRMQQVRERSAGGVIHVETYAEPINELELTFEAMSRNDYLGLLDFFVNEVNGQEREFWFDDERGTTRKVRFMTGMLDFPETFYNRHAGTLPLEVVS